MSLRRAAKAEMDSRDWVPLPALMEELKQKAVADLHARLAAQGFDEVRPAHGCVFRFIDRDGMRLTGLAELAGLTKQAVGEFVADLEELGYVERVPDPADRRAKIIRLTKRGIEAQRAARQAFADIEARWAEEIGERRVGALRDAVERILVAEREASAAA